MTQGMSQLLPQSDLKSRLDVGEIFKSGTWDPSCIRAVGYDLRMADDLIVVPNPPDFKTGKYYPRGKKRVAEVILQPGDTAFVSSVERLCLPWDIAGQLGPKFGLASKGLLTLTGTLIDPGYGLEPASEEDWRAKEDERLHFLLANVGHAPVVLVPGKERIATILFCRVDPPETKAETKSLGFARIEDAFLSSPKSAEAGLVFFRNMADLAGVVQEMQQRVESFDDRLSGIEAGSNQVVMFGLYLVCLTFLGVAFTTLLTMAHDAELVEAFQRLNSLVFSSWLSLGVFFLALLGATWIVWSGLRLAILALSYVLGIRRLR